MVDYLELINRWMGIKHYQLLILIIAYLVLSTVDFIVGSLNAVITEDLTFSSKKSQIGIIRKLVILVIMIAVIPLAMMLPLEIGGYSLTVLYSGLVISELYSILAHIGVVKDGNKNENMVATLFQNFLNALTKNNGGNKNE